MRKLYGPDGNIVGCVDALGIVTLGEAPGPPLGLLRNNEVFADAVGSERLGFVDANGRVLDEHHELTAMVDSEGKVVDNSGRAVGQVEEPRDAAALLFIIGRHISLEREPPLEQDASPMVNEMLEGAYGQDRDASSRQPPPGGPT